MNDAKHVALDLHQATISAARLFDVIGDVGRRKRRRHDEQLAVRE